MKVRVRISHSRLMIITILSIILIVFSIGFFYTIYKIAEAFLGINTDFIFGMFGIKRKKKN